MARNFDLSVRLKAAVEGLNEVSALISEIQDLGGATEESASRSRKLSEEIRELEKSERLVDSFRKLKTETATTADELEKAQQEAQRLGAEFNQAGKPTQKLERDFEKARKTVQRLKDTQQEQVRALQTQRQELNRAGIDSRNLSQAQVEIRQSMERTSSEVEQLTRELRAARDESAKEFKDPTDRLERGARSAGQEVEGLGTKIRNVAGIALGSVAAFFGIQEAVQGIVGIARVGGQFEILQKRLEALTGSAEAGEEAFAWIQDFTRNTPFQLDQVTDAFVRAKAFGLDPMDGTLQAIADQASKTGGGMEALNGIVTALGQAYSKGKIQAEEMLQLVERGVPAWDLLAQATGRSVAELQKMTTAGELGRKEIELLIKALGESSAGAAQDQMQTLAGLVSNLRDTWNQFLREINDQGLLDYLKNQIRDIAAAFEEMRESGELQQWAKRISDSIIGLIEALKTVGSTLYEYRDAITATAKAWLIYKTAQAGVGLLSFATMIRTQAVTAMADLGNTTGKTTGRMGKLGAVLSALPGPAKIVALAAAFLGIEKAAQAAGDAIATYITKYSEGARILAENEAKIAGIARDRIETLKQEAEQLEQYRQVRQVSTEEALKLSEDERAEAERRLKAQEALFANEARQLEYMKILGLDVAEAQEKLRADLDATRASLANLAEASDTTGKAIENGISAAAQQLVDNFEGMIASGKDASEAVEQLFDGFDASSVASVRNLVEAIGAISEQSVEAGLAIEKELRDRLDNMTGSELKRFSVTLRAAFDEGTEAASRFGQVAEEIADAALRNIGTSFEELRTGISEAEREALDSFQTFTETGARSIEDVRKVIGELKDDISSPEAVDALRNLLQSWASESGNRISEVEEQINDLALGVKGTAEQIGAELKEAIQDAGNEEAIEEVKARIQELWNEGKIGGELYAETLALVRDRQRELADEADNAKDSIKQSMSEAAQSAENLGNSVKNAKDQANQAGREVRSVGNFLAQFFNNTTERLLQLGEKVHDAFLRAMRMDVPARELDGIRERIETLNTEIARIRQVVPGFNVFTGWLQDVSIAAKAAERDFLSQKLAVEQLLEEFERGDYSARILGLSVADLERRFDLLGDQDLAPLRSAVQRIQAEVDGLNNSLNDTIASLRQELASLRGDTVELENLRYQEQRLELEQQLQRARELGDRDAISAAQEALDLQRQAYQLRVNQAREQQEQERQKAAERAAEEERRRQLEEARQREEQAADFGREERAADRQQSTAPSRTIVLQGPRGGRATVAVSEDEEGNLLDVLEDLGYRSNG